MCRANPLWGAPRIPGELLKLGIDIGQTRIGTIRRECLDHVIIFSETALYRQVKSFVAYYHESRIHLSAGQGLTGVAGSATAGTGDGSWLSHKSAGLHHRYEWRAA
jgi:hypothetical protein